MGPGIAAILGSVVLLSAVTTNTAHAAATGVPQVASGARPGPDVLYAKAPRAPQLENTGIWKAEPILVSSGVAYRDGEWIYQDFLHDDRGAAGVPDPSDPHDVGGFLFSPKAGTLTYPTNEAFANNAADLVELRIRPLADGTVAFRVTLNSLADPDRTAFTIAVGSGGNGEVAWPYGAGVRSSADRFLTVHGTTADLRDRQGAVVGPTPTATVDRERRQFEVRVPPGGLPFEDAFQVVVGVGLWDPARGEYLAPSTVASATTPGGATPLGSRLFNVGPRTKEPFPDVSQFGAGLTIGDAAAGGMVDGAWWREKQQSEALSVGTVNDFRADVDLAKLRAGTRDDSQVPTTGPLNRILPSAFSSGQGIDHTEVCFDLPTQAAAGAACEGRMQGQLQPYALYVPQGARPAGGYGFTLLLHSLSANYNQYTASNNQLQVAASGTQNADAYSSLVATPNGRGPDGFYAGVPEADAFEVWADVARHYPVDPDRARVTGYSMGGFGTIRLLARWPDLFAKGWSVVGAPGSVGDQLASLRNTPLMTWNAAADELVNLKTSEDMVTALGQVEVDHQHLLFPAADHLTLATNDEYRLGADFLATGTVNRDPARITYVVDPREDAAQAGVVADHDGWLSDLRVRDAAQAPTGTIDVRSRGFGEGDPTVSTASPVTGAIGGSRGGMSYTARARGLTAAPKTSKQDVLIVRATNVGTATVDARRARVSCAPALDVQSDGPLDLRIACATPKRCVSRRRVSVTLPRLRGRAARADRFTRVTVKVGSRKATTTRLRRGRRTAPVDLRGLRAGRVKVTITARTAKGRTVRLVRTYRTCAAIERR